MRIFVLVWAAMIVAAYNLCTPSLPGGSSPVDENDRCLTLIFREEYGPMNGPMSGRWTLMSQMVSDSVCEHDIPKFVHMVEQEPSIIEAYVVLDRDTVYAMVSYE